MSPWSRRRFLAAGTGAIAVLLAGCTDEPSAFDGRVLVIGAGPAGMTAAHLLRRRGVEVEVLEAGSTHGGRIRHDLAFADFPIPLGAEWLHVDAAVLDDIVGASGIDASGGGGPGAEATVDLVDYQNDDRAAYVDGASVEFGPLVPDVFDGDKKFRRSSWLDFFDRHVMDGISDVIRYDSRVVAIDHGGDRVTVTDADGGTHEADRVIVTVPLAILARRDIAFDPPLEPDRLRRLDEATVWSGLKAFFEFDEAFYPVAVVLPDSETAAGQRLFYDAAYGQDSAHHILGLFSVGAQAEVYQAMTDDELRADVLAELDDAFAGAASRSYVRHLVWDWNEQPFARGAYLEDDADPGLTRALARPLSAQVFFAGDSYTTFDDWGSVHAAAWSAIETVDRLLG